MPELYKHNILYKLLIKQYLNFMQFKYLNYRTSNSDPRQPSGYRFGKIFSYQKQEGSSPMRDKT